MVVSKIFFSPIFREDSHFDQEFVNVESSHQFPLKLPLKPGVAFSKPEVPHLPTFALLGEFLLVGARRC